MKNKNYKKFMLLSFLACSLQLAASEVDGKIIIDGVQQPNSMIESNDIKIVGHSKPIKDSGDYKYNYIDNYSDPRIIQELYSGLELDFRNSDENIGNLKNKNISFTDAAFLIHTNDNEQKTTGVNVDVENSNLVFEGTRDLKDNYLTNWQYVAINHAYMNMKNSSIVSKLNETLGPGWTKKFKIRIGNQVSPWTVDDPNDIHWEGNENQIGLSIERDVKDPNVYDIDMENGNLEIYFNNFIPLTNSEEKIHFTKPVLRFGKNTRTRLSSGGLYLNGEMAYINVNGAYVPAIVDENERHVIFEKDSEVEIVAPKNIKAIETGFTNIFFEGGKVKLRGGTILDQSFGCITGEAIFDIKGKKMKTMDVRDMPSAAEDQKTILEMLPGSRVQLESILSGNSEEASKRAEVRSPFKLQFDNDTVFCVTKVNEADITMKEGSKLYLYDENTEDLELVTQEEWDRLEEEAWDEEDAYYEETGEFITIIKTDGLKVPNGIEFRGKLKLENADIYLLSNIKNKVAEKLIVTDEVVSGTGGTIHVKNSGGTDTDGTEKVNLIEAKKGIDSTVDFVLANNVVEAGAYEYSLDHSFVDDGIEYYLIGEKALSVPDVKSGIKNDEFKLTKPQSLEKYIFTNAESNPIEVAGKKLDIHPENQENYISVEDNSIALSDSEIWQQEGRGIKLKNTPLRLKNSSLVVDTRDTNSGLKIDVDSSIPYLLHLERDKKHTNKEERDLFVNGQLRLRGIDIDDVDNAVVMGKNTIAQVYNPKGDKALDIKNTNMTIEEGATLFLNAEKNAIHSVNSRIIGDGVLNIRGNISHEGKGGIDLTLEEGSQIDSSSIQAMRSDIQNNLHFKKGSSLYIDRISNVNMEFDKGSSLSLYSTEDASVLLKDPSANRYTVDQFHDPINEPSNENTVVFSGVVTMNDVDIYSRVNLFDNIGDRFEAKGENALLRGTGAILHLTNIGASEVDNSNRTIRFFTGKMEDGFKWKLAHPLEIGAYTYNTSLESVVNDDGITTLNFILKEKKKREAKLTSTAMGFIENIKADYFHELGSVNSILNVLDSRDFVKDDSLWATVEGVSLKTKEDFSANGKGVYVGYDKQLGSLKELHGGFFAGNNRVTKKYDKYDGSGDANVFTGGLYLSYRSSIGDGDFIVKYAQGDSKYNVLDSANDRVDNDYDYISRMAAFQFGKKLQIFPMDSVYLKPSIKASYGEIDKINSTASNGLRTKLSTVKTWVTGGELEFGYEKENLHAYLKAGIEKEFLGDVDVVFNTRGNESRQLDEVMSSFGAGLEYRMNNQSISLEVSQKNSTLLNNFYQASLSYKYSF